MSENLNTLHVVATKKEKEMEVRITDVKLVKSGSISELEELGFQDGSCAYAVSIVGSHAPIRLQCCERTDAESVFNYLEGMYKSGSIISVD